MENINSIFLWENSVDIFRDPIKIVRDFHNINHKRDAKFSDMIDGHIS